MAVRLSPFFQRETVQTDANGAPRSGALLFVYAAGTSTKSSVWQDSAGSVAHTNPIVYSAAGLPPAAIWLAEGSSYKFVLAPSNDTDPPASPILTIDNVPVINDVAAAAASEWTSGPTPTYISATSFSVTGDQTTVLHIGRRIKTTNTAGTRYSTIIRSVFSALTTVTVANDSGSLDSGLSALWYSISSADNTSVPFISTDQQCGRLVYVSTTQIRLDPQDGNSIWVNTGSAWKRRLIPSAGITAANTNIRIDGTSGQNLVANTLYWVHLFDNAGTLTIDFSSGTAPAVDTTSGLKIKTGVASRALIGMVRTNASTPGQFQAGLVASWYKRRKVMGSAALTTDRTRSETSATELHSEIRVEFLSWSEEAVLASYVGYAYTNTVTASHTTSIYLNNLATLLSRTLAETPTANLSDNVSQVASFSVSEGHHYVTVAGHVGAGTGHWPAGTLFVVTER